MAHERKRHLGAVLKHLASLSPLVGLLGHRQAGKTTLLEGISAQYLSFDDESILASVEAYPTKFW